MTDEQRKMALDALAALGIPVVVEGEIEPPGEYAFDYDGRLRLWSHGGFHEWEPWSDFDQAQRVAEAAGGNPDHIPSPQWCVWRESAAAYGASVNDRVLMFAPRPVEALLRAALAAVDLWQALKEKEGRGK